MQPLGVSDGGDVDAAERDLVIARGDRLVETDPDCRARLALSASEGHDADTVRRDAQGCGARTCSPSRPSFWCKTGPDTLARATIASYYKEVGSLESQKFRVPLIRLTFTHGATVWVPAESWRWATCCFFGGGIPHVFHVEHVSDGASMRGDAVTAYRQTIPWNPSASRPPAPGPPSLTGLRAQPTIGFLGRGERSCPSTSPAIPERHPRRCSRDSRRPARRHRRSLRSGAPRRPLHPWRQGSPAGYVGGA